MRKLKRSTMQAIIVSFITILVSIVAFGTVYFFVIRQVQETYKARLSEANKQLSENQKEIYVAKNKICMGEEISKDNLKYEKRFINQQTADSYITDDDIGKIAVVDIEPDMTVLKNMISKKIDNDLREEEFNVFYLSSNLTEGDFVDIRIIYPNGEDYIVLSKKAVKDLSLDTNNCFMWLNEEEILTTSGAIVDAYLNPGSKLYTTKYIEPKIQEASQVTYCPSEAVINLIKKDPNVVQRAAENLNIQIRNDLESRLNEFYSDHDGSEIKWESNTETLQSDNYYEIGSENLEATNKEESEEEIYYVD